MKKVVAFVLLVMFFAKPQTVWAQDYTEEILEELELEEVDEQLEIGTDKIDFESLVSAFTEKGMEGIDKEMLGDYVFDLLFYELEKAGPMFVEILSVSFIFALFGKVLVTKKGYVSELGFFTVYTGIMLLLLQSFSLIGEVVEAGVEKVVSFMTAFIPTYAATLMLTGGGASAGAFYELAFGLIYLLELGMKFVFLPGIPVFVLILLLDHFFEEPKLSKLAKLIEDGIRLLMKMGVAAVVGLGVVQSLLAPAKDRLAASSLYHGLEAVPGVGNTFGAAGEILVGCGIMIKNSVGAAALVLLLVLWLVPLLKVFCFYAMYRVTAAVLWPFCDRRIAKCVQDVARGSSLYLTLILDIMLLFFITISVIGAASGFIC